MKIIYLILVAIFFSCNSTEEEKPQERTIVEGPNIEVKPSGNSVVITKYSDSTITIVNLNAAGELLDSSTIYPKPNFDGLPGDLIDSTIK